MPSGSCPICINTISKDVQLNDDTTAWQSNASNDPWSPRPFVDAVSANWCHAFQLLLHELASNFCIANWHRMLRLIMPWARVRIQSLTRSKAIIAPQLVCESPYRRCRTASPPCRCTSNVSGHPTSNPHPVYRPQRPRFRCRACCCILPLPLWFCCSLLPLLLWFCRLRLPLGAPLALQLLHDVSGGWRPTSYLTSPPVLLWRPSFPALIGNNCGSFGSVTALARLASCKVVAVKALPRSPFAPPVRSLCCRDSLSFALQLIGFTHESRSTIFPSSSGRPKMCVRGTGFIFNFSRFGHLF